MTAGLLLSGSESSCSATAGREYTPACGNCHMRQLCLPTGMALTEMGQLEQRIGRRRRIKRDERLYAIGDAFSPLYAIRFGHFKTFNVNHEGAQQVTGFQMAGELLGMDAISSGRHRCNAVALDDSEVCEIPYAQLEDLCDAIPTLARHFHRILSQEIMRKQDLMLLLGNMRAEQRFAAFLVGLSARYLACGYSATRFQLRMSREDIGNYLGLTMESVSRLLSRFRTQGWLAVDRRELTLLNLRTLKAIAAGTQTCRNM
jgi:CRP/FNR family transcriptional regulator